MFNKDKFLKQFIVKVDGIVWDLMTGSMGVLSNDQDEILSLESSEGEYNISQNLFASMSMPIPAFATKVGLDDIQLEDLIFMNGKAKGWVIGINKKEEDSRPTFELLTPSGTKSSYNPPKTNMAMGFSSGDGAMVLKPLISLAGGDKKGLGDMQSQLMPLMLMGGGDELEEMLPMILMMGQNGINSGSGGNNMMQMMMMMKMMSGSKNPLSGKNKINNSRSRFFD